MGDLGSFDGLTAARFSKVKLRTKVTHSADRSSVALAMVFQLPESAPDRWRAITGAHLAPPVPAGGQVRKGGPGRT